MRDPIYFKRALGALVGLVLVLGAAPLQAINYVVLEGEEDHLREPRQKILPYGFYNDTTELAVAAAYVVSGYFQPQMFIVGNAFTSSNGSNNLVAIFKDVQIHERLFLDQSFMLADYGEIHSYQNGNSSFPDERAGSHDSDKDNYVDAEGSDRYYRTKFRYLLPIGDGASGPIHTFVIDDKGLLVEGSEAGAREWNPLTSGRTITELELFYRKQDLDTEDGGSSLLETSGVRFSLEYDNADFYQNPTRGSRQRVAVFRDFGTLSQSIPWTSVELEATKYFNIGATDTAAQRVLATTMWWADAPTWDSSSRIDGKKQFHRPPLFAGATLWGARSHEGLQHQPFSRSLRRALRGGVSPYAQGQPIPANPTAG
ncbi:hypothetical protein [Aestuariirhabdus sp. LZHN29]|uniref:hypothetical protein n=1 Tax=Aestuariirhabdus sp. LZHN29 TaxID=3417462 RepID=UPI003CF33212